MTSRLRIAVAFGALVSPVSSTLACPTFSIYRYHIVEEQYDAVAIAIVKSVTPIGDRRFHSWEGHAQIVDVAAGKIDRLALRIAGDSLCQENQPQPKVGERWVVYIRNQKSPKAMYSVPLWKARKYDPRFRKR